MKTSLPNLRSRPDTVELERRLRAQAAPPPVPADLHDSIMTALEQQQRRSASTLPRITSPAPQFTIHHSRFMRWLRWLLAPALAICLLSAFLLYRAHLPAPAPGADSGLTLSVPAGVLQFSYTMADSLPATLAPLSDELNHVQNDLDRTADFLVASLP